MPARRMADAVLRLLLIRIEGSVRVGRRPGASGAQAMRCAVTALPSTKAMVRLAILLEQAGGVDNRAEAEQWYRSAAAEHSDVDAMFNLGVLLDRRDELTEAEHWYRSAAERGYGNGMLNLASLLQQQGGVDNRAEAERWYRSAIEEHVVLPDLDHPRHPLPLGATRTP
jgi:hypothetical protein